jgi:hypothetical protein
MWRDGRRRGLKEARCVLELNAQFTNDLHAPHCCSTASSTPMTALITNSGASIVM